MSRKNKFIEYRRKREYKTDYGKRLKLLKGHKTRLVVRMFSRSVLGQLVNYKPTGDVVEAVVNSLELKELGWKYSCSNLPAAYLAGFKLAKVGIAKGVKEAVLDLGFTKSIGGSKCYSFVKGAVDGGLEIPVDESVFPDEARIRGEHIVGHFEKQPKGNQYAKYKKDGFTLKEDFEKVKGKILKEK